MTDHEAALSDEYEALMRRFAGADYRERRTITHTLWEGWSSEIPLGELESIIAEAKRAAEKLAGTDLKFEIFRYGDGGGSQFISCVALEFEQDRLNRIANAESYARGIMQGETAEYLRLRAKFEGK